MSMIMQHISVGLLLSCFFWVITKLKSKFEILHIQILKSICSRKIAHQIAHQIAHETQFKSF